MNKIHKEYFEKADVLHLAVSDNLEADGVEISPNVKENLNKNGELIEIEIHKTSEFVRDSILESTHTKILRHNSLTKSARSLRDIFVCPFFSRSKKMKFETISLIVTVFLALFGYLITYWNNIRISKRNEQLELVERRISEFYGPLYVSTQTSHRAYHSLLKKLKRNSVFDDPKSPVSESDKAEWRLWVKSVFMPYNERIEKLIVV